MRACISALKKSHDVDCFRFQLSEFLFYRFCGRANSTWTDYRLGQNLAIIAGMLRNLLYLLLLIDKVKICISSQCGCLMVACKFVGNLVACNQNASKLPGVMVAIRIWKIIWRSTSKLQNNQKSSVQGNGHSENGHSSSSENVDKDKI